MRVKKEDIMGANIFVGIMTAIVIFAGISAWRMENIGNDEKDKKEEKKGEEKGDK